MVLWAADGRICPAVVRFLQADGGILQMSILRQPVQRSAVSWSGLLLLILLAHLSFMSSPLHGHRIEADGVGVVEAGLTPADEAGLTPADAVPIGEPLVNAAKHVGHCAIEWLSPQGLAIARTMAVTLSGFLTMVLLGPTLLRPSPCVPGPLKSADRQALLQVFRT